MSLARTRIISTPTIDGTKGPTSPMTSREEENRILKQTNLLKVPVWQSLRSPGAKLYAWVCAAKLSSGFGAGLCFSQARYNGLRERALEAATRMLDYLSLDDDQEEIGSRLDIAALREIGADIETSSESRRANRRNIGSREIAITMMINQDNINIHMPINDTHTTATSTIAATTTTSTSNKNHTNKRHHSRSGLAIAQHLAAFRFQCVVSSEAPTANLNSQVSESTNTHVSSVFATPVADSSKADVLLSAASAAAAKAYGLEGSNSIDDQIYSSPSSGVCQKQILTNTATLNNLNQQNEFSDYNDDISTINEGKTRTTALSIEKRFSTGSTPIIELYPRTRTVAALHRAIGRGDAIAVQNAAIRGAGSAGSFEVGAFITMARALHVAAAHDGAFGAPAAGIIEALANTGADVCAPDALGYTPLHVAAATGNIKALKIILEYIQIHHGNDGARRAAARRCHNGFTALEIALTRRRDMREFFASMLCRARAFDVIFPHGSLGIKLALVRHAPLPSIENKNDNDNISTTQPNNHQSRSNSFISETPPPPPPPPPSSAARNGTHGHHRRTISIDQPSPKEQLQIKLNQISYHRRVRSHDDHNLGKGKKYPGPRTLQVASVTRECRALHDIEVGDQLLAINGTIIPCPDETEFPTLMAQLKEMSRPLRATFVAGNYPYLSVEDDSIITLLETISPRPARAHIDILSSSCNNSDKVKRYDATDSDIYGRSAPTA
mmetsp:Transcript_21185/g.26371  ORF Transcript_21185/g.26371 Transcript_21185/m.26371 type:complete len:728 (-) Transcript_21185:237-2420(-)